MKQSYDPFIHSPTNNIQRKRTLNEMEENEIATNNVMIEMPSVKRLKTSTNSANISETMANNKIISINDPPPPSTFVQEIGDGIADVYYENGNIWCNVCSRWIDIASYVAHQRSKKHEKNIESFAFRSVIKHWQTIRTQLITNADLLQVKKYNIDELCTDENLWYAQICLSCLTEVQTNSWQQHLHGQIHKSLFMKYPRKCIIKRCLTPGENIRQSILFNKQYFMQIANYVNGSRILILGEQDFSYSLAVCNILGTGENIICTSYLAAYDILKYEPEEHPADDGERAHYFRKTLPSHNGQLQQNLLTLKSKFNAECIHSIDATKLFNDLQQACVVDGRLVYSGPFDIIVFPFPRASLRRGCDFRNSTLIQGFFNEIRVHKKQLLFEHSQIQLIVLENQFKDWDLENIAKENGWILKWRCMADFNQLFGYQPRELSGKAWSPKDALLLVFLWDTAFDIANEEKLCMLNSVNHLALLPEESVKLKEKAIINDRLHMQAVNNLVK